MPARLVLFLLLALPLTPFAGAASAGDDAGCGCDAGDERADALPVATWEFAGAVTSGDGADWYRVEVPAGHAVEFTFTGTAGLVFLVTREDGGGGEGLRLERNDEAERLTVGARDGVLFVGAYGAAYGTPAGTYRVRIEDASPAPDLRIVRVETRQQTDGDPLDRREVRVHLSNPGFAPALTTLEIGASGESAGTRHVASIAVELGPGESGTYHATWDTTGMVGRVHLRMNALVEADLWPEDNELDVQATVGPEVPVPFGIDVSQPHVFCPGSYYAQACLLAPRHSDGRWEVQAAAGAFVIGPVYKSVVAWTWVFVDTSGPTPMPVACANLYEPAPFGYCAP